MCVCERESVRERDVRETISANGEAEVGKLLARAMERVSETERVCERKRNYVVVCVRERESVFVCVNVCVRKRGCVCEREWR